MVNPPKLFFYMTSLLHSIDLFISIVFLYSVIPLLFNYSFIILF